MRKNTSILLIAIVCFAITKVSGQSKYLIELGKLDSLYSNHLKENREFWVQLPESFDPNSSRKYPVTYVLDGGVHLGAVLAVYNYYSSGFTSEMIIVGISNRRQRTRDLTTSKISRRRGISFNQESGGAENFTQFIRDELIPYIESKYPATPYRTLIGHSYAGLFTINTLIHHTDLFDNYLAIDPSLDWDHQKLLKEAKKVLAKKKFTGKSLFISLSGQLHRQNSKININNVMQDTTEFSLFPRSIIEFSRFIEKNKPTDLRFAWKFYPKDIHGTVPLPSIRDGLLFIFEWFQMEETDKINSPGTSKGELLSIINHRAQKLQKHFGYKVPPYPEELFNMLGYMSMEMKQLEKAKMYFEKAIEYYPKSANAYDSIAEYYVLQNDYQNALIHIKKAFSINPIDYYKTRIEKIKRKIED